MLEIVSWFVMFIFTYFLDCYIFSKVISEKFVISKLMVFLIITFSIFSQFAMIINDSILKFIISNLFLFILLKLVYRKNVSKTLIGTLFIYIGYVISEIVFSIIFIIFMKININFFKKDIGVLLVNISVMLINFLIFKLDFVVKFVANIIKWYDKNRLINLLFRTITISFLCYIIVYITNFNDFNYNNKLVMLVFLFGIILFVCGYFKEKSGNNKLNIEYAQLLDYVKTYESEVVDKSKKQHEYKNQLIVIDNLISNTNKRAKEYLKKVLNNIENVTDNDWLIKLNNLPSGGIKGLIHFKIKKMIDKKISVFVYVDKKLSRKDIWGNIEKNLEDISRILGVYLDNAIEASENSVDKQIIIEFVSNKENIEFILSNTYDENINFDELDKEGYSTKGKGRGVGLSLVKDIINNNNILTQSREINGKFYVQKLYIKNKI